MFVLKRVSSSKLFNKRGNIMKQQIIEITGESARDNNAM